MNIFDSDADDGLSPIAGVGLVLVLGFGAYILWQVAYARGAKDVFQPGNPGCIVTSPGGQAVAQRELRQREHVVIPKGATLTSACPNPA